ncbi:PspA-associated protein PspAA [Naumannella cuiyingiana]|uniref:PspA-associated domain-containing protein n=1 Tax=Naumannella cuiyingiana TaxID=1347891 RepID=A0A7Z0DAQ8_9ACTN|nr:hypothetical protein [Naumannella cuiyingiana]
MIIRIVGEGQFELPDDAVATLDPFDDQVEAAVKAEDPEALGQALQALHAAVIDAGTPLADDALVDSDLILPAADASLAEVHELLGDRDEGLIPNG